MFSFVQDIGNYENRKVANYESNGMIIDTCRVSDGRQPFETGISHPEYDSGEWVIVEAYDDKDAAQKGHDIWVAKMSSSELPEALVDCANARVADLFDAKDLIYPRIPK